MNTMNNTVHREMLLPQPPQNVWQAITDPTTLAEWMFPNDFQPRIGHKFTFNVPGNPAMKFDGLTVRCEVLACKPPHRLVFTWCVGGPVAHTEVSFELLAEGTGTRLLLNHAGFDLTQPNANQAFKGADYGWVRMLGQLTKALEQKSAALQSQGTAENS